jgi:hypothetical protein
MKPRGRKTQVVDTNVAVVANRRNNESYTRANNCVRELLNIKKLGVIVIDDGDRILSEYRANCSPYRRQPGVGDAFVRWVHDNRGRADLVHTVALTVGKDPPHDFVEFPDHKDLAALDQSDRKFVAVANAHRDQPAIIEATDSKWWGWKDALAACGIGVEFLCPKEIEQVYRRKMDQKKL